MSLPTRSDCVRLISHRLSNRWNRTRCVEEEEKFDGTVSTLKSVLETLGKKNPEMGFLTVLKNFTISRRYCSQQLTQIRIELIPKTI